MTSPQDHTLREVVRVDWSNGGYAFRSICSCGFETGGISVQAAMLDHQEHADYMESPEVVRQRWVRSLK